MKVSRLFIAFLFVVLLNLFLVLQRSSLFRVQAGQSTPAITSGITAIQQTAPQPDPPGTIDGAKNPELIPDAVAYRLLFLAVAEPENATEEQKARARAKINPAGLSEEDVEAFLLILGQFDKAMNEISAQLDKIRERNPLALSPVSADGQAVTQLDQQRELLMADTIAALPRNLSPDGVVLLQDYLQEFKRGIKYLPDK